MLSLSLRTSHSQTPSGPNPESHHNLFLFSRLATEIVSVPDRPGISLL